MERCRIESFESMPLFFQNPTALIFKIAGLHRTLANEQNACLVIEFDPEFGVPRFPNVDTAFGERGVFFVRTVSGPDGLADVVSSRERLGQGTTIGQDHFV